MPEQRQHRRDSLDAHATSEYYRDEEPPMAYRYAGRIRYIRDYRQRPYAAMHRNDIARHCVLSLFLRIESGVKKNRRRVS